MAAARYVSIALHAAHCVCYKTLKYMYDVLDDGDCYVRLGESQRRAERRTGHIDSVINLHIARCARFTEYR